MNIEKIIERGFILKSEQEEVMVDENLSKVNLVDEEGQVEGIWTYIIKGKEQYKDDQSKGDPVVAVLANQALCWYPNPSWGRVIEFTTNGSIRPTCQGSEQVDRFKATHEAYMNEWYPEAEEE